MRLQNRITWMRDGQSHGEKATSTVSSVCSLRQLASTADGEFVEHILDLPFTAFHTFNG